MRAVTAGPDGAPPGTALLGKAFGLLRQISRRHRNGWTLSDLSKACRMHHATAHRILRHLLAEGMVAVRPGTKRYVLGPLALELGVSAHPLFDPRPLMVPGLRRLARLTGGTAFLNVRSGFDSVCIAREEGRLRIRALAVEVGARRPLCTSAGGAAILLELQARERDAAIAHGLDDAAGIDATRAKALLKMIRHSERVGFGINADDIIPGITAIGVAVHDRAARPVAALSVATYSSRLSLRGQDEIVAALRTESAALEKALRQGPAGEDESTHDG